MWALVIFALIGLQILLALISPVALVYLSLAIGAIPIGFGEDGPISGALGKMDLPAFRLLGLWLAASAVLLTHSGRLPRYLGTFKFHLLFLVFCLAAVAWAPSIDYALRMFAKLSSPLLFLLLIMTAVSTRAQLRVMERLVVLSGLGMAAVAVAMLAAGVNASRVGLTLPGLGPALFSALMVVVAVTALAGARYGHRLRNFLAAAVSTAAVLAAFTRITIAGLFVGCSVVLFVGFRGVLRLLLPILGLVGLPALFLFNETFKKRMFYGDNKVTLDAVLSDPSILLEHLHTSGRSNAWGTVLGKFFYPNPTFGSGLGATQNYYYSQTSGIGVIHSEYVRLLSEVGVVGISLFALTALAYLWRLLRIYRRSHEIDTARYALAALGALVAYLIFIATDNGFDYVTGFGIYVFALIGMAEKSRELEVAPARAAVRARASTPVPTPAIASV
jgi:O-antigen ligase